MKLVSWNVNGLRACIQKGFETYLTATDADLFCLQEIKLQAGQLDWTPDGAYSMYWNYALKKGYSGTAIFSKIEPLSVQYGFPDDSCDEEGRMITLAFTSFYLVNVYSPNARRDLSRLPYRLAWEDRFYLYIQQLGEDKPVIVCGDMNVAYSELDLKNAKGNRGNSGFTIEERDKFSRLLDGGLVDTFRHLYPEKPDAYTWWSYMPKVRERNIGWRIDYFLVSSPLTPSLLDMYHDEHILGSDHCPIVLQMKDLVT